MLLKMVIRKCAMVEESEINNSLAVWKKRTIALLCLTLVFVLFKVVDSDLVVQVSLITESRK